MNKESIERWRANKWSVAKSVARRGLLNWLPDKPYLSVMYRANFGKKLDWKHPQTFSEKLQWLKLNDRNPIYTQMADKYAAKVFCSERINSEYVVPVVGGPWESPETVDVENLPDQFVLKTNHDCGGVLVCRDKSTLNMDEVKQFLQRHMKRKYYLHGREWPYKDVVPKIFAEAYLQNQGGGGLCDYKFFTFNGEPKVMYIARGRDYSQKGRDQVYADFFDMEFNHLDLKIDHENCPITPEKPETFELMIDVARRLAQGTKHLRIDFYEVDGRLYVGELTFFHCGGLKPFITDEWDAILGSWIDLD